MGNVKPARGPRKSARPEPKSRMRKYAEDVLEMLFDLASGAESEAVRVSAIKELLDRGFGKSSTLIGPDSPPVPASWGERNAMTIEVGLGAAGFEQDLAALTTISQDVAQIVTLQQGVDGPLVTAENVYNLAIDKAKALRRKQPERYFTNPALLPQQPQGAGAQAQPQMPPELMAQIQASNLEAQAAQMKAATTERGQNIDAAIRRQEMATDAALKKYEIDQKTRAELLAAAIRAGAKPHPSTSSG